MVYPSLVHLERRVRRASQVTSPICPKWTSKAEQPNGSRPTRSAGFTVNAAGQPQSSPVWFLFDDGRIYIQSQPTAAKLRNIASNERVSFHLDDDGQGGDIVSIDGRADVLDEPPKALFDKYLEKYQVLIRDSLESTTEDLAAAYSVTIRVSATRVRTW
jgi:PPOX class probable F420-dependent enzyme